MLLFKKLFSFVFNKKTFNLVMSFIMVLSLTYVTIETIDPEPALAAGEFTCENSEGAGYVFQSTYSSGTLSILRGSNDSSSAFTTSTIETFSSWSHGNIEEVNSLSITKDGEMYAILKRTNTSII